MCRRNENDDDGGHWKVKSYDEFAGNEGERIYSSKNSGETDDGGSDISR